MSMKHGPILIALAGVLALATSACSRDQSTLTITGSSTIAPVISDIAERYETDHDAQVDVQSGGTGRGINDVQQGLADIGMVSRALTEAELETLRPVTIAQDGIAMIVHADNPVAELTADQIRGIYTGTVDNWAAVGGRDAPITVVNKATGRSTLALFLEHFELDNRDVAADVVIGENQQGIKTVAGNPNAIGYVSIGTAEYEAESGTPIKRLPLNGVAARIDTVNSGRYPLRRELNLVTLGAPDPAEQAFLDFATGAGAAAVYRDHYFVPNTP